MSAKVYFDKAFEAQIMTPTHARLLGNDPRIREINELIRKLAKTNLTVFVTGETGTGKDIVATLIHNRSARASRPFIKINFPSIPESILENELFGHERGAFTGAHSSRPGRLELARDGTIFMDEITEVSPHVQCKLIPVLDGEPFIRIGGTRPIPMKARIVAAANMGLDESVAQGRLHADVAFRLREVVIFLPPLRERPDDIPLLAEHFNYNTCKMLGRNFQRLDQEVVEYLKTLPWPGNVRELAGRIKESAATGSYNALFGPGNECDNGGGNGTLKREDCAALASGLMEKRFMSLNEARRMAAEQAERSLIEETLRYTLWNRRKAAKLLNTSYSSLLRRIDRYKIGNT